MNVSEIHAIGLIGLMALYEYDEDEFQRKCSLSRSTIWVHVKELLRAMKDENRATKLYEEYIGALEEKNSQISQLMLKQLYKNAMEIVKSTPPEYFGKKGQEV